MPNIDYKKSEEYVKQAKSLPKQDFHSFYFWLTVAVPQTWAGHPRGVPRSWVYQYVTEMNAWEKSHIIYLLGEHLKTVIDNDYYDLVKEAKKADLHMVRGADTRIDNAKSTRKG